METSDLYNESNRATYSPEDNKLRLYVGRVPHPEYEALRAQGWTSTPKQTCDFVAHWTPERRDTAIDYAGIIEDEDMGPEERAADRAERFMGYQGKRLDEATDRADRFESGPSAFGYQNQQRAERAAARHDRIAGRACDAWGKAEYWQSRTAGVISHALHVSSPAVRMGRIKEIEADIRRVEKSRAEYADTFARWTHVAGMTDTEKQNALALKCAYIEHGDYTHPRTGKKSYLYDLCSPDGRSEDPLTGAEVAALWLSRHGPLAEEGDWLTHYRLRLAYETQMLEAQGGRAAFVEMEVGGWVGSHQIRKVNKSNATGRVVSVTVAAPTRASYDKKGQPYSETNPRPMTLHTLTVERMAADIYRPPTAEDKAALDAEKKAEKAAAPKKAPCPLVNPTEADAEKLVAMWNANRRADFDKRHGSMAHLYEFKSCEVRKMPQAFYSANSQGAHARAETRALCSLGRLEERSAFYDYSGQAQRKAERGPAVCQIRTTGYDPVHVIVITDKPQKALPAAVWEPYVPAVKPDDSNHTCEKCNHTAPLVTWEPSGSLLFNRAGIVCPNCEMHQAKPATVTA